ncbi:MAG: hypothetical protein ACK5LZ_03145 [Anaerorhabdus sp.]
MSSYEILQLKNMVTMKSDEIERLSRAKHQLSSLLSELRCAIKDVDKYCWQGPSRRKLELIEREIGESYQNKIHSIETKIESMSAEIRKIEC